MEPPSTETGQVDAQSEEWFASYAEPANQRRRVRLRHSKRDPRRERLVRLHRLKTMMMFVSVVFVAAMTAGFYAVLTR
jgi:hypothetical protein